MYLLKPCQTAMKGRCDGVVLFGSSGLTYRMQTIGVQPVIGYLFPPSSFLYLHALFSKFQSLNETTTTSKPATYTLKLVSHSLTYLFADSTEISKPAAVTYSFAGIWLFNTRAHLHMCEPSFPRHYFALGIIAASLVKSCPR